MGFKLFILCVLWKANNITFAYVRVCIFIWFYYKQLNNKLRDLYQNYHQLVFVMMYSMFAHACVIIMIRHRDGCEINYVSFGLSWTDILCYNYYISVMETTGAWLIQRLIEHLITVYFLFCYNSPSSVHLNRTLAIYMKSFVWTLIDYSCCWSVLC